MLPLPELDSKEKKEKVKGFLRQHFIKRILSFFLAKHVLRPLEQPAQPEQAMTIALESGILSHFPPLISPPFPSFLIGTVG
tara:strand:- start:91 stop:333 length:243 start_codon:yes stop_codon:yes gene_type:complete